MSLLVRNLRKLIHFDRRGNFFSKENCSLLVDRKGTVVRIFKPQEKLPRARTTVNGDELLGLPCFVDCHSHALYGGNRAAEFEMKCEGKTYLEIAAQGGGILSTQQATQQTPDKDLISLSTSRIAKFLEQGIRGLEIKTGYGLDHGEEIRHLKILNKIKRKFSSRAMIWITYLGPHAALQPERRKKYIEEICEQTLPRIAKEGLADFVDIFVDEGFFSIEDMDRYFSTARKLGLSRKAHIDEIKNLGAAQVAIRHQVTSVDHCRHTKMEDFQRLHENGIQTVLLPATSFYIDEGFIDMADIRKSGAKPAISLDYNPGSQPALWWPFLIFLAMKKMRMTAEEALHATTVAPLKALNARLEDWALETGSSCKLNLFRAKSFSELGYRYGENLLERSIFYHDSAI